MRSVFLLFLGLGLMSITGCETTCEPVGTPYCEGDVLKVCAGDGEKGVMEEDKCPKELCEIWETAFDYADRRKTGYLNEEEGRAPSSDVGGGGRA